MTLKILAGFLGLSGGLVTGFSFVSFLTVLDIFPRVLRLTETEDQVTLYETVVILGGTFFTMSFLLGWHFDLPKLFVPAVGIMIGTFLGMISASLTEILNVIPVVVRRMRIKEYVKAVLTCILLGKVMGSLLYWLFPSIWQV